MTAVRYRVLVIDDEFEIARALARLLRSTADVVHELGVERVVERLRDGDRYDLIMCDVMMPGMDGVEVFERIVAEVPAMRSVFVFASGGLPDEMGRRVLATGRPLLLKPVTRADLTAFLPPPAYTE